GAKASVGRFCPREDLGADRKGNDRGREVWGTREQCRSRKDRQDSICDARLGDGVDSFLYRLGEGHQAVTAVPETAGQSDMTRKPCLSSGITSPERGMPAATNAVVASSSIP